METGSRVINKHLPALLALSIVASSSYAQEEEAAIVSGSFSLEPSLGTELLYDNNIFRSSVNETTSWIMKLSPRLVAALEPTRHRYAFEYRGDYGWYFDSSDDNYNDHFLRAGANFDLTARNRFEILGSYDLTHEPRGTGQTEGFDPSIIGPDTPDRYNLASILGRYVFGSPGARGRLSFQARYNNLEYTNNRQRTRFNDRDGVRGVASFAYKARPRIALLLEGLVATFNYPVDRPGQTTRNSTEYEVQLGATWDTTAKTTGIAKLGYIVKRFDAPDRGDPSGISWEVDVIWSPRTYSHIELQTSRFPSEALQGGNFVANTLYAATWRHEWAERFESRLSALFLEEDFRGSATSRIQDTNEYTVAVNYQMRRWLNWELSINFDSRDSNIDQFVFDRTVYRIGAFFSL